MGFNIDIIDEDFNIENLINNTQNEYEFSYYNTMQSYLLNFEKKKSDLILLNLCIKDCDYEIFLEQINKIKKTPIILLSTNKKLKLAEKLLNFGFSDIIAIEDFDINKKINKSINDCLKGFKLGEQSTEDFFYLSKILFNDKKIKETLALIEKISKTDIAILIQGEHGVGKEIYARLIHSKSKRQNSPFVIINSVMLEENNIEKTLFGYFDSIKQEHIPGKFELANGGTVYFDEINDLKFAIQSKILRILQDKELELSNSNETIKLDFRVISSSSKNLFEEINKGNFKENLFYRINAFTLKIDPLKDRKADIPLLTKSFIEYFNKSEHKNIKEITPKALNLLANYSWPGNVRELKNVIFRVVSLSNSETLDIKDFNFLKASINCDIKNDLSINLFNENSHIKDLNQIELEVIQKVMGFANGNISMASKLLNVGRATFYRKLKELNITVSDLDYENNE